jgi:hypothetical protein
MRGGDVRTGELFSYVDLEDRVRRDHPLRAIRLIVNEALGFAGRGICGALFADRAAVDRAGEAVASHAAAGFLFDPLGAAADGASWNMTCCFRWFVGIGIDDAAWDHSVFSKNRDRLLEGDIAAKFLSAILVQPRVKRLLSTDHFSVDGTLVEAWASMKSVKPKDGSGAPPAGGGGRNAEATSMARSAPMRRMPRRPIRTPGFTGKARARRAKLCFMGHGLMENRHGLLVDACLTEAGGHAERVAALHMIEPRADRPRAITLGADKAYDTKDFVNELRSMRVTPHVAQNTSGRTVRRSMGARRGMPATGSACASASKSRRRSAGSKPLPGRTRRSSVVVTASDGPSPSRPPPMTWFDCRS